MKRLPLERLQTVGKPTIQTIAGEGVSILTGLLILGAGALLLVWVEPQIEHAYLKVVTFAGYTVGAFIFALIAIDYGRSVGMAGWFATASATLVGVSIVYMIVSLVINDGFHNGPPPEPPAPVSHTYSNFVPPVAPRKYRSVTRRTLNAIKVYNPREHWKVKAG